MKRFPKYLGIAGLVIAIVLAGTWYWALHTSAGARFIFNTARDNVPGVLDAAMLEGNLADGLSLSRVSFANNGLAVTAAKLTLAIDVDLIPLGVEILAPEIRNLQVTLPVTQATESADELELALLLPSLQLPLPVTISELSMHDFALSTNGEKAIELITSLGLSAVLTNSVSVSGIALDSPFGAAIGEARLDLEAPFATEIDVHISDLEELLGQWFDPTIDLRASGNGERVAVEITAAEPDLSVSGFIDDLFGKPRADLTFSTPYVLLPLPGDMSIEVAAASGRASGDPADYSLTANAQLKIPYMPDATYEVAAHGGLDQLNVDNLTIAAEEISAAASGSLAWYAGFVVTADAQVVKLDPGIWADAWPDELLLEGGAGATLSDRRIELRGLDVSVIGSPVRLTGSGEIDYENPNISGLLAWTDFSWPLTGDTTVFEARQGEIQLDGMPGDWRIDGRAAIKAGPLPEETLIVSGHGDLQGAVLEIAESQVLGGQVQGSAQIQWVDEIPYSASLEVANIQTSALTPDFPAELTGAISIDARQRPFSMAVDVEGLEGTLFAESLVVSGDARFGGSELQFVDFSLQHGNSSVELDGDLFTRDGLSYEVQIDDLQRLSGDLAGELAATGLLSLAEEQPRFRSSVVAERLSIGSIYIESLEIEDLADESNELINQRLLISDLQVVGNSVGNISLSASGDTEQHQLEMTIDAQRYTASMQASGTLRGWQRGRDTQWQGMLQKMQLSIAAGLKISLGQPSAIALSKDEFTIDRFCLYGEQGSATCAIADWNVMRGLTVDAAMRQLPVSDITALTSLPFDFTQELSGKFYWQQNGDDAASGNAALSMSAGEVINVDNNELTMSTGPGSFGFVLRDGELQSGELDLPIVDQGDIDIDFSVAQIALGLDSPVTGSVFINLADIGSIVELFPALDDVSGSLSSDFSVAGTVRNLNLEGDMQLHDGELTYDRLGMHLQNMNLVASASGDRRWTLSGDFGAGEGTGRLSSSFDRSQGLLAGMELELSGSNLKLVDVPELIIVAEPDVRLRFRDGALQVDGSVLIPRALVKPANLSGTPVSESADVTIIAGELPAERQRTDDEGRMLLGGQLTVGFGDDVMLDLGVAEAKLGGTVDFTWDQQLIPMARGSYSINGKVSAFGQVLEISEGTVRFPNVMADNPNLSIRAEREIFGNTQVKTAGIFVTGSARKPTIEPYTIPLTTEERALTLLVTGSDFDYEAGVGALDFGVYIAPKLFLSYGIGLFERDNVISARYDLKKGFGIKATSGQKDSGVDLSYRFEN